MQETPSNISPKVADALRWIVAIFEHENIDYQILGGTAASFYGVSRSINDIDIDIHQKDFFRLYQIVKLYITFGPELYIDSEWMVLMMDINYHGQEVEITNGDFQQIFNDQTAEWKIFQNSLENVVRVSWEGMVLRLMPPKQMLAYKKYLHGDKQKSDREKIASFLAKRDFYSDFSKAMKWIIHFKTSPEKHANTFSELETRYLWLNEVTRYTLIVELIEMRFTDALDFFEKIFSKEWSILVRHEIAFGIGIMGNTKHLDMFLNAIQNGPAPIVRHEAAIAIANLGDTRCLPTLLEVISNSQEHIVVVESAKYALAVIMASFD